MAVDTAQIAKRTASVSAAHELKLWALAVIIYGPADSLFTIINMEAGGYESNAIARTFMDWFGYSGLFVHKLVFFIGIAAVVLVLTHIARRLDQPPAPYRLVVAGMLTLRGIVLFQQHVTVYTSLTA